jgi:betaine reductase
MAVVVTGVANVLAHAAGLVRYGSRPARDVARDPRVLEQVAAHLRSFDAACAYAPNQAYIGGIAPEDLAGCPRPWFTVSGAGTRAHGPFGRIIGERELLRLIAECDRARLVTLGADAEDLVARGALPIDIGGALAGCIVAGHEEDEALTASVLLENLACKATGVLALRELLAQTGVPAEEVDFVIAGSEEAVGDRYQRGGGNIAKAIGEQAGLTRAAAHDVKSFCASTLYAMLTAGAYVETGLARRVAVVAGGSLAKLGMKYRAHVAKGMPILEDMLAGIACFVERDDGTGAPLIRLDTASFHRIGDGSSQQAVLEALVTVPLARAGLTMTYVDRYVTEMHNPEVTEPAGSGDVPSGNYKLIAGLAALKAAIPRGEMARFIAERGMPGYAPTQGHIASAVCYLAHACAAMREGRMRRALFMAKGSLFLGRLTELSDGVSVLIEAPGR